MTQTQELDCSDAAKMIIARMQTNPEDFNYGGKLYRMTEQAQMSARDLKAYNDAHDLYILEPRLMVSVLEALMAQPEENGTVKFRPAMTLDSAGNFGLGVSPSVWGTSIAQAGLTTQQRITREQFEDHIQTHKSPMMKHIEAVAAKKESVASQIYNRAFGRERVERDN